MFISYFIQKIVFLFSLKISSAQLPPHTDLQKIGAVTVDGEIYKILEPRTHEVSDYVRTQNLRRDLLKHERVFIDKIGFRHHWNEINDDTHKGSRKSIDIKINKTQTIQNKTLVSTENKTTTKTIILKDIHENIKGTSSRKDNSTLTSKKKIKRKKKRKLISNSKNNSTQIKSQGSIKENGKINKTEARTGHTHDHALKVAKTTFFCPFFGVINMKYLLN